MKLGNYSPIGFYIVMHFTFYYISGYVRIEGGTEI